MPSRKIIIFLTLIAFIGILAMCRKPEYFSEEGYDERLTGGAATSFVSTTDAFSQSVEGLSSRDQTFHGIGDAAFEAVFVTAPASVNGGLGPIFNNVSCASCHQHDGKGMPTFGQPNSALLMRVSIGNHEQTGPIAIPGFGTQIQDKAIYGKRPECNVSVSYQQQTYTFFDGESYTLQTPIYTFSNPYTTLPTTYLFSPRMALPVFGMGLLEEIPESNILALADDNDKDGDGISGKPNNCF